MILKVYFANNTSVDFDAVIEAGTNHDNHLIFRTKTRNGSFNMSAIAGYVLTKTAHEDDKEKADGR